MTQKAYPWIAVDLDGTLAVYHDYNPNNNEIGPPVPAMVALVKTWLAEGKEVKIMTARVAVPVGAEWVREEVQKWCVKHIGQKLDVVCHKDYMMTCLYDDRCVQVERNTGRLIGDRDPSWDTIVYQR